MALSCTAALASCRAQGSSRRQQRRATVVCCAQQPTERGASRRTLLAAAPTLLAALAAAPAARADGIQDLLRQKLRPEGLNEIDAIIQVLDARGVLYEIKSLAATPSDSQERRAANSLLPGYASRLRKLANAAPTAASLAAGGDKEAVVSSEFGGEASGSTVVDPVFITVLNYSGRGLSPEALQNPAFAEAAITAVEELLGQVPENMMSTAVAQREAARAARLAAQ